MYSTCLHCNRDLGTNDVLETLPIGRRIAFDAAQGRLWVVCRHCAKWNLVPFDTRLESIDACERIYRDTATRYSTGTIGLARTRDGLDLVRIGEALRPEFAAWRYGESYRRRRRNSQLAGGVAVAGVGAAVVTLGAVGVGVGAFMGLVVQAGQRVWDASLDRRARFRIEDPDTAKPLQIERKMSQHSVISWETDRPMLEVPLGDPAKRQIRVLRWSESELRSIGRKVTGGLNLLDGSNGQLDSATQLLAAYQGDLARWLRQRAAAQRETGEQIFETKPKRIKGVQFTHMPHWRKYAHPFLITARLPPPERLAVEMWMNEDIERTWLSGELRLLEREWKNAEKLAKIADDLVLPDGVDGGEG